MPDVEQVGTLTRGCAQVLVRRPHPGAEMSGSVPGPTRVEQDRARERYKIGISGRYDGLRLLELSDEPDGNHGYANRCFYGARQWHLIVGADWDALSSVEAATRDVNGGTAVCLECLREHDALRDVPSARDPVRAGHTHAYGSVRRKGRPHGVEHLEWETHAVLEAPTVLVRPAVREGRKELM